MLAKAIRIQVSRCGIFLSIIAFAVSAHAREPLFVLDRSTGLTDSRVYCMLQAADGKIWIGTGRGLHRFDGRNLTAIFAGRELVSNTILSLCQTPDGLLWVGTDRGISRISTAGIADTAHIALPAQIGEKALDILCDAQQTVWVRSEKGIAHYSQHGKLLQVHYRGSTHSNGLASSRITSIATDDNANIWIGTADAGLEFYNVRQNRFLHYGTLQAEARGIVTPNISGVQIDRNGSLWISNARGGAAQIQLIESSVRSYTPGQYPSSGCSLLPTDPQGNIWTFFFQSGLYYKEQGTDTLSLFTGIEDLPSPVRCLLHSRSGHILAGTAENGVYVYGHPASSVFSPLRGMPSGWDLLCDGAANFVWMSRGQAAVRASIATDNGRVSAAVRGASIRMEAEPVSACSDASSRLWVLGADSVLRVYMHEGQCVYEYKLPSAQQLVFCTDDSDNIIFSQDDRLYRCRATDASPSVGAPMNLPFHPKCMIFVGNKYVLVADASTYIWDGVQDRYAEAGYMSALSPIFSVARSAAGDLILGTRTGIYSIGAQSDLELTEPVPLTQGKACYELQTAGGQVIGTEDSALVSLRTNNNSVHRWLYTRNIRSLGQSQRSIIAKKSGALLVQTPQGLKACLAPSLFKQDQAADWQITVLRVADGTVAAVSSSKEGKLHISEDCGGLLFQFGDMSLAHYGHPTVLVLPGGDSIVSPNGRYRLTPAQIGTGAQTLTIFPQGKPAYSASFSIQMPSGYAGLWWLAALIVVAAGALVAYRQKEWLREAKRYVRGSQHDATVRELYQAKLNFFTEISHEIRTPLTMIIDPVDQILKQENLSSFTKEKLRIVLENGDKILNLVNGLLDYRKLETGSDTLLAEETDMGEAVELTVGRFRELAVQRSQEIVMHIPDDEILLWIDRNKFDKTLSSIMENVLMNNPEGSTLGVWLTRETSRRGFRGVERIAILVHEITANNSEVSLSPQIEQFFTETNASNPQSAPGLGLVLAKKLIELHKGELIVERIPHGYYRFKILLNCGSAHLEKHEMVQERLPLRSELYDQNESAISDKKSILLVEDNNSVLSYLDTIFFKKYDVLKAANGREGLELAQAYIPDIIISDVMMPEMDGNEMCRRLKNNHTTAHIPIIMLTAKTFAEDQVEGLEAGADDYIHKPFKSEILELKVRNILDSAERMRKQLKNDLISMPTEAFIESEEDKLMKKLIDYIDRNISDTEISVETLAAEMGVSRAQLFRKTRAVLGQTPNDLLKSMRLKKAEQLLRQGKLRISDIAFEVGFPNPQYFSQSFVKMYGATPSAYQKQLNINEE